MYCRKIAVLGAGTWGIALARLLSKNGHEVTVWSAIESEITILSETYLHPNLPDCEIPKSIAFTSCLKDAIENSSIILFVVPSPFVRDTAKKVKQYYNEDQIIVNAAKGIEASTLYTMTQVIKEELGSNCEVACLSGPTHAEEVARDIPSTIVSACENLEVAEIIQDTFMCSTMRVYTNPDLQGVELCSTMKNIIALAVGISSGLGYGDNTRAALITRGMAEITQLGKKMGCFEQTFLGLAGIGDLIVTATSHHSRNNRCGMLIGQGVSVADAVKQIGMVVEGINALPAAMKLKERYQIEMPIVSAVNAIICDGLSPEMVASQLMTREKKSDISKSELEIQFETALLNNGRGSGMKRVITYGTFDLLHYGHINLLKRAKALGDYLIVVVSSDEFNWNEKHKKTYFSYEQRKQLLESIRYVDLVIPEENWQQKRSDMHEYHVDTFVMGDDWKGKFDFLKEEGVEVVYLPRTPEISTSQIKKDLYDANDTNGESQTCHDDIDTNPQ